MILVQPKVRLGCCRRSSKNRSCLGSPTGSIILKRTSEKRSGEGRRVVSVIMRACVLFLSISLGSYSPLAIAQVTTNCATCVQAEDCGNKRATCNSECRARMFAVDPRRAECLTRCFNNEAQCAQAALSSCRSRNACSY